MNSEHSTNSQKYTVKAFAPLFLIVCILIPALAMTRTTMDGAGRDIASLVILVALIGTAISPAFIARCAGKESDGDQAS